MTSSPDNWRPTPELLAAYFDGECEGRDDLSLLKQRIENWLAANPQAQEDLAEQRRLLHLWQETAPPEPTAEQWSSMLTRLEKVTVNQAAAGIFARQPHRPWHRNGLLGAAAVLAGLAIYLGWNGSSRQSSQPMPIVQVSIPQVPVGNSSRIEPEDEIFPVASASEVTIVRVEGADAHTLVVGELPLQGMLELVSAGDVILTLIRPEMNNDELSPVRLIESSAPMIWAKLESETDD